jgi:hypothetical protein
LVSPEERISRVEGVLGQMNERLSTLETRTSVIEDRVTGVMVMLDRKADKTEVRFLFGITFTLFAVTIGLIGAVLTKL